MRRPPAVALCLLAAYLTLSTDGCMETVRLPGRLGSVLQTFPDGGSTCRCCALCHRNPACASLSFSTSSGKCQLYSSVAGYDTLIADPSWTYFVMPRRSQHHQFCRQDSDCLVQGDFCRGRVCTDLNTVTCRTIIETFGAKDRFGHNFTTLGWIGRAPHSLFCQVVGVDGLGFTRIFLNTAGTMWTRETVDNLSSGGGVDDSYSLLYLTDDLLLTSHDQTSQTSQDQASQEPTYKVLYHLDAKAMVMFDAVPRTEPLVAEVPRKPFGEMRCADVDNLCSISFVSLPYRSDIGSLLLVDVNVNGKDAPEDRSLARTDGRMFHGHVSRLAIFIRE